MSGSACALVAVALVGCGRYQPPSDHPEAQPRTSASPAGFTITRCEDVPPPPKDPADIGVSRSAPDEAIKTVYLAWVDRSDALVEYTVRVDDPTCGNRPDIRAWFTIRAGRPRFEDARIVVRPGEDRAYVGYTVVGSGENQYASLSDIRAVGPSGQVLDWKHQTATGGPADIIAMAEPMTHTPATGVGGDAFYFDASTVKVGEIVRVTFKFPTGPVRVPFRVVAAAQDSLRND